MIAQTAAKSSGLQRRFSHELLVVDFASARFIIETADRELVDNLVKRVQDAVEMVDPGIKVHKKGQKREIDYNLKLDRARLLFHHGRSHLLLGFIIKA